MAQPITVRFRWTADELLAAHACHERKIRRPAIRLLLYGICALALAVLAFALREYAWMPILATLPVVVIWSFSTPLNRWLLRRQFQQRPDRDMEITWQITPEKLAVASPEFHAEFTWETLAEAVATEHGMLLYPVPTIFHWLPRHGFYNAGDFEAVTELARSKATKYTVVR